MNRDMLSDGYSKGFEVDVAEDSSVAATRSADEGRPGFDVMMPDVSA